MKRKRPPCSCQRDGALQLTLQQWFVPTKDSKKEPTKYIGNETDSSISQPKEETRTLAQSSSQAVTIEPTEKHRNCSENTTPRDVDDVFQIQLQDKGFPFLAVASTLDKLQETKSRLSSIEILSDLFLAILLKSQEDLLPAVFLCTNSMYFIFHGLF